MFVLVVNYRKSTNIKKGHQHQQKTREKHTF